MTKKETIEEPIVADDIDIAEDATPPPAEKTSEPSNDGTRIRIPKSQPYFFIAPDQGEWFWGLYADNGRLMAVGGRGYATKHKANEAVRGVIEIASNATTKVVAGYELTGGKETEPA